MRLKKQWFVPWNGRRLIAAAALLHLTLAVSLFAAGRMRISPTMIDKDGIVGSFAFDSFQYQEGATELAELLKHGHIVGWLTAAQPVHTKIIAIPFAILGPLFGYGTLAAEPYNLLFYAAVIALVFAMGREAYGRRAGLVAGAVVAIYPSFLLHTMQVLKDPLVVAASLALVLCVMTWLTRKYGVRSAAVSAVCATFMAVLIFFARPDLIYVVLAMAVLGLILLGTRQLLERRFLLWNMVLPLPILLATVLLLFWSRETIKQFPASQPGPPKNVVSTLQVPSLIVRASSDPKSPTTLVARLRRPGDSLARRITSMRFHFAAAYPDAGSLIDSDREFRSVNDLFRYLPRAMEIGLWAPFPNSWISFRRRVGNMGEFLAGAETFFIYLFQVLALYAVVREPRRLAVWFLLALATLALTAMALVVPNVGALYRYRYAFWLMIIVVAMTSVDKLFVSWSERSRVRQQLLTTSVETDAAIGA